MNIEKLYKRKEIFKNKIENINSLIENRWEKLIGFGCGYFKDWSIGDKIINIEWTLKGNGGIDKIPIEFFDIEDHTEAVTQYKKYRSEQKKKEELESKNKLEIKEKEEYERLKQKFE